MQHNGSGDSTLWRSLAVAFGDGLAFGVGMKLAQNSPRLADRAGRPEDRVPAAAAATIDRKALEAIVKTVQARLEEQSAQIERRFAESESRVALEMKTLVSDDLAGFREQMALLNRELGEAVGRLVAEEVARRVSEQVAAQVTAQTAALRAQVAQISERFSLLVGGMARLCGDASVPETVPGFARSEPGNGNGILRAPLISTAVLALAGGLLMFFA